MTSFIGCFGRDSETPPNPATTAATGCIGLGIYAAATEYSGYDGFSRNLQRFVGYSSSNEGV